jgi:TolA-binding protein
MEKTTLEMLEDLQEDAHDTELRRNPAQHHRETQQQIRDLERAFDALGEDHEEQPCPAIEGLQKEAEQNLKDVEEGLNDNVILLGVVETEAHEIAVYDGLITSAAAMGRRRRALRGKPRAGAERTAEAAQGHAADDARAGDRRRTLGPRRKGQTLETACPFFRSVVVD